MNKKHLTIGIIMFFSILIISIIFFLLTRLNKKQHIYLNHSNGKSSNIFIDCKEDSDCKLSHLSRGCESFYSINKNNSEIEIEKYNEKESKLSVGINNLCTLSQKIEEPICKNNVCSSKEK